MLIYVLCSLRRDADADRQGKDTSRRGLWERCCLVEVQTVKKAVHIEVYVSEQPRSFSLIELPTPGLQIAACVKF